MHGDYEIHGGTALIRKQVGYGPQMSGKVPGKRSISFKMERTTAGGVTKETTNIIRAYAITPNIFIQSGNTTILQADVLLPEVMFITVKMFLS